MTTKTVSRNEIKNIPRIPFTKTWSPVHHSDILTTIDAQLKNMGLQAISENLQVSADGKDMFGTMGVQKVGTDALARIDQLGFRTSMKKNFSLGFVAGQSITVCSNMQFYGEFEDYMRHDPRMTPEGLSEFTGTAIRTIQDKHGVYRAWFDQLGGVEIDDTNFKELTHDVMDRSIINPKDFRLFCNGYRDELRDQPDFAAEQTLAHFHGAVTRVLRKSSTRQQMTRSRQLNTYMEDFVAYPTTQPVTDDFII